MILAIFEIWISNQEKKQYDFVSRRVLTLKKENEKQKPNSIVESVQTLVLCWKTQIMLNIFISEISFSWLIPDYTNCVLAFALEHWRQHYVKHVVILYKVHMSMGIFLISKGIQTKSNLTQFGDCVYWKNMRAFHM